jgi:hypothetical protein
MRWLTPLLVLVLSVGVLAGCGDDDDDTADTGSTRTSAAEKSGVTVTMKEYAYAVSGKLAAGDPIELKNEGNEVHMMGIGKLKAGVTVAQLREALAKADPNVQGDPAADLIEEEVGWPGGFVTPGSAVTLSADGLEPGTYGLICFIPTEGGNGPHFAKGMIGELDVEAGTAATAPTADATYKVTPGQAIQGPATLEAGERTIEVTGDGDISKQEPQLVRATSADQSADAINDILNKYFAQFESDSGPEKGTSKQVAQYIKFAGFDFGANHSVRFTYDFEPGTYYLAAPDTDTQDEGPSKTPVELIKITVS